MSENVVLVLITNFNDIKCCFSGDYSVWADAAGQVMFSLSLGSGGMVTVASYNKFNNNFVRSVEIH